MILCHQCAHWRGNRALDVETPLRSPEEEWRTGTCDRLRRILDIAVQAGWDGGTVGAIDTPASFGCVEGQLE